MLFEALEAELDEGGHFSGFGILGSSVLASTSTTTGVASSNIATTTVAPGTGTGTGTDFGPLAAKGKATGCFFWLPVKLLWLTFEFFLQILPTMPL